MMNNTPLLYKRKFFFSLIGAFVFILLNAFDLVKGLSQLAAETQTELNSLYDSSQELTAPKKMHLQLTEDGFLRCRKTFSNGKVEYHSFNIGKLSTVTYLGNDQLGNLQLQTLYDDIIVQTYNDRHGNVDSMSSVFTIPLKKVSAEDLLLLQNNLLEIKRQLAVK